MGSYLLAGTSKYRVVSSGRIITTCYFIEAELFIKTKETTTATIPQYKKWLHLMQSQGAQTAPSTHSPP